MPDVTFIIGAAAAALVLCVVAFFLGINYRKKISEKEIGSAEAEATRIINEAIKSAESRKKSTRPLPAIHFFCLSVKCRWPSMSADPFLQISLYYYMLLFVLYRGWD